MMLGCTLAALLALGGVASASATGRSARCSATKSHKAHRKASKHRLRHPRHRRGVRVHHRLPGRRISCRRHPQRHRREGTALSATTDPRPFAPSSFWNAPLPANAALDGLSSTYVSDLRRQLTQWRPWINTTDYSTPVYTVGGGQPTVRVKLETNVPALQAAWERVPIPAGARPASGSDETMVVWQPSTDTLWEFWLTQERADGWHARWGGRLEHVSSSPGYYANPSSWGASGTSLPMLGGLVRLSELRAGRIDHALAIALPQTRAGVFSWPAQRSDGRVNSPQAIPEGTRFRIDPRLDLSRVPMSPVVRQMALAAQRYGMVVRDTAGAVAFYAEDPTPTGSNPFTGAGGFFAGQYPSQLLAQFPWAHLQALRTSLHNNPN